MFVMVNLALDSRYPYVFGISNFACIECRALACLAFSKNTHEVVFNNRWRSLNLPRLITFLIPACEGKVNCSVSFDSESSWSVSVSTNVCKRIVLGFQ